VRGDDRVNCVACGEPMSARQRTCPHCGELQPSQLITVLLGVLGLFGLLVGGLLGLSAAGVTRLGAFLLAVVGFGLMVGSYTHHLDRQAERRSR